jgi:hypothetical protein
VKLGYKEFFWSFRILQRSIFCCEVEQVLCQMMNMMFTVEDLEANRAGLLSENQLAKYNAKKILDAC